MLSVRDYFMSNEVQSHIASVIHRTAQMGYQIALANKNLSNDQHQSILEDIKRTEFSDITQVSCLFRNRYEFHDARQHIRKASLLSIYRSVQQDHRVLLDNRNDMKTDVVEKFYGRLREIDPIVQTLKFYRNYCAHNMNMPEQTGWSTNLISATIRLCEIALTPKNLDSQNSIIIDEFKAYLHANLADEKSSSNATQTLDAKAPNDPTLEYLSEIKHKIIHLDEDIKKGLVEIRRQLLADLNKSQRSNDCLQTLEEPTTDQTVTSSEVDDESDHQTTTSLSPELLRQRLSQFGAQIKEKHGQTPGFGADNNLFQLSNIGAILQHEPKDFDAFIDLKDVKSRTEISSPLIQEQIKSYRNELDKLLFDVLWSSDLNIL